MLDSRIHFGVGFTIGILITALFFYFFSQRYEVTESNRAIIKQDKWSGASWQFEGNEWKKIQENKTDWKPVDKILVKALNISADKSSSNHRNRQVEVLKSKYPALEGYRDEDIIARIKYVYARQVMLDLYFNQAKLE